MGPCGKLLRPPVGEKVACRPRPLDGEGGEWRKTCGWAYPLGGDHLRFPIHTLGQYWENLHQSFKYMIRKSGGEAIHVCSLGMSMLCSINTCSVCDILSDRTGRKVAGTVAEDLVSPFTRCLERTLGPGFGEPLSGSCAFVEHAILGMGEKPPATGNCEN